MYDEPDTDQNADPTRVEAELFGIQPHLKTSEPLRFSLAELLIATTVAAVLLGLFRAAGILGAVLAFGAAIVFTLGIYPQWKRDRRQQTLMFDFVWGIVMPIVCLVFDPFIFKQDGDLGTIFIDEALPQMEGQLILASLHDESFVAYPFLAWQIVSLLTVLIVGRMRGAWAALFAGALILGTLVAAGLGLLLFPASTIGLFMVIGILGYTPLFTAYSYGRRVRQLWTQAGADIARPTACAWAIVGAVLAIVVPATLGVLLLGLARGFDRVLQ